MAGSNSPAFPWVNLLLVIAFLVLAVPLAGFVRSVQGAEMQDCIVFVSNQYMELFRSLWGYALKFSGIYPVIYSDIPDVRVLGPETKVVIIGEPGISLSNQNVIILTGSVTVSDVVHACGLGGEK